MKKLLVTIAFILLVSSIMVGCGTSPATTTAPASTSPSTKQPTTTAATKTPTTTAVQPTTQAPPTGGTLVILTAGSTAVNLGKPGDRGSRTDQLYNWGCVESLMTIDANGDFKPLLAEKYALAPDSKSITFTLRKGVKFHDGTDCDAEAVKYCLELGREGSMTRDKNYTIEAIDKYTVKVSWPEFTWNVMNYLTNTINIGSIVSPTALKAHDADWAKINPIGTGPFKFVSYTRDTLVKYVRFDDYWGGKPYLDGLEYKIMADSTVALLSLKAGEGHALVVEPKDANDLKQAGFNLLMSAGNSAGFVFNSVDTASPFSNVKVRQAFSYAIDRQKIADSLGYGYIVPTFQVFGPDDWAYSTKVIGQPYNPDNAKKLLAEAGYPSRFKTTLHTTSASDLNTLVQFYARQVGIDVDIDIISSTVDAQLSAKGWDGIIALGGLSGSTQGYSDPVGVASNFFASIGSTRVSSYRFPDVGDLERKAGIEPDKTKRKALYDEMMRLSVDEHAQYAWVFSVATIMATSPKLHLPEKRIPASDLSKAWLNK